MFRNNIRNSFIITAWEWLEVDQKDPKLNGFLYHLPLASSSPHEEAPWHRYSSTAAWSWREQYLCNSPTGSQWRWLRSPWISSDRCPWIPGTGQKQETLIRWTISVWLTGNLFTYGFDSQHRRNLFPLQSKAWRWEAPLPEHRVKLSLRQQRDFDIGTGDTLQAVGRRGRCLASQIWYPLFSSTDIQKYLLCSQSRCLSRASVSICSQTYDVTGS